jgi:hypothetical protein
MRMIAAVLLLGIASGVAPALAQTAPETSENGRYTFKEVPDGLLRLDGRTGQVSLCSRIASAWACRTLPDDRVALENEIGRLLDENTALKKELQARATPPEPPVAATPAPPAPKSAPDSRRSERFQPPSDQDIDQMMSFLEKVWRRLLDMAERTQREFDHKGPRKNMGERL